MLGRMRGIVVMPLCLVACAGRAPAPYAPDAAAVDRALADAPPPALAGAPSWVKDEGPRQIVEPRALAPERSGRRVTLRLAHAPLGEAVRLLAGEAGLGVVLADPLEQPVSLDVRRADPRAVLDALATAHGLLVERSGGLLIVRRRGP